MLNICTTSALNHRIHILVDADDFIIDASEKNWKGNNGSPYFGFNRGLFDLNHMFRAAGFDFLRDPHNCGVRAWMKNGINGYFLE